MERASPFLLWGGLAGVAAIGSILSVAFLKMSQKL
jgi:hypothetical protein